MAPSILNLDPFKKFNVVDVLDVNLLRNSRVYFTDTLEFTLFSSFLGSMLPLYMALSVCFVCTKNCQATSNKGMRLRFGMLTVLTNIR